MSLPGSKSISNRVLLLAALAEGRTEITGLLDSDDTRVMLTALRQLGVNVSELDAGRVTVEACGAFRSKAQSCSWATPAPPFVRSPPRWP